MRYFRREEKKCYWPLKYFYRYRAKTSNDIILFEAWKVYSNVFRETGRKFKLTKEGLKKI